MWDAENSNTKKEEARVSTEKSSLACGWWLSQQHLLHLNFLWGSGAWTGLTVSLDLGGRERQLCCVCCVCICCF